MFESVQSEGMILEPSKGAFWRRYKSVLLPKTAHFPFMLKKVQPDCKDREKNGSPKWMNKMEEREWCWASHWVDHHSKGKICTTSSRPSNKVSTKLWAHELLDQIWLPSCFSMWVYFKNCTGNAMQCKFVWLYNMHFLWTF